MYEYECTLEASEDLFQMDEDDYIDSRCGEVFITGKNLMVFCCSLCSNAYGSFISFLRHLLNDHYEEESDDCPVPLTKLPERLNKIVINSDKNPVSSYEQTELDGQDREDDNIPEENPSIEKPTIVEKDRNPLSINSATNLKATIETENSVTFLSSEEKEIEKLRKIALGIYSCDKCDRVYKNNRLLQIHRRTHESNDRKHKCEECGFAFKDSGNLRHHIRRHHSQEKRYACPECPKMFYGRSEKDAHLRFHSGERPYICPTCGKTFKHLSTLNKHNLAHTGIRPYECKLCGKGFNTARRFKEHASVHTGQRNLICNICQATFSRDDSLKNHMKLHENKREYACTICESSFNQRPALLSHLKAKHKIVSTTKM